MIPTLTEDVVRYYLTSALSRAKVSKTKALDAGLNMVSATDEGSAIAGARWIVGYAKMSCLASIENGNVGVSKNRATLYPGICGSNSNPHPRDPPYSEGLDGKVQC